MREELEKLLAEFLKAEQERFQSELLNWTPTEPNGYTRDDFKQFAFESMMRSVTKVAQDHRGS